MRKFGNYLKTVRGKVTLLGWLILGCVLVIGSAVPALAADAVGITFTAFNIFTMLMLKTLLQVAADGIAPFILGVLKISLINADFLLNHAITIKLWGYMLTVANAIYLLALVIAAVAIITRLNVSTYNIKKVLGSFIMAVALTNFSLIIVKILFGLGTKLNDVVYALVSNPNIKLLNFLKIIDNDTLLGVFRGLLTDVYIPVIGGTDSFIIAEEILITALTVIIFWLCAKLALLFLERMIRLFIAAVTAPIIFASSMLPAFQKSASGWWDTTIKWVLVMPITIFVLLISLFFFEQAGFKSEADFHFQKLRDRISIAAVQAELKSVGKSITFSDSANEHLSQVFIAQAGTPSPEPFKLFDYFWLVIAMFALYSAGNVSNMMKLGSVMTGMVESPGKLFKPIQGVAKNIGGIAQKPFNKWMLAQPGRLIQGGYTHAVGEGGWKPAQKLEQTRLGLTGFLGGAFNPVNEAARRKANKEIQAEKSQYEGTIGRINQAKGRLDTLASAYSGGTVMDWDKLDAVQKQSALQQGGWKARADAKNYKDLSPSAGFLIGKIAKRIEKDDRPLASALLETMRDETASKAERGAAIKILAQISTDKNRDDKDEARGYLQTQEVQDAAKNYKVKIPGFKKPPKAEPTDSDYQKAVDRREQFLDKAVAISGLDRDDVNWLYGNADAGKTIMDDILWTTVSPSALSEPSRNAYKALEKRIVADPAMTQAEREDFLKTNKVLAKDATSLAQLSFQGITSQDLNMRQKLETAAPSVGGLAALTANIQNNFSIVQQADDRAGDIRKSFSDEQKSLGPAHQDTLLNKLADAVGISFGGSNFQGQSAAELDRLSSTAKDLWNNVQTAGKGKNMLNELSLPAVVKEAEEFLQNGLGMSAFQTSRMTVNEALKHIRTAGVSAGPRNWSDVTK